MKKQISSALMAGVTLAAVLAGSQAFAGAKYGGGGVNVSFSGSVRWASGNLLDVRNTSDPYQHIGCSVNQTDNPSTTWAQCAAANSANESLSCFTQSPVLIEIMKTIGPSTNVGFHVDNTGTCTLITAYNYSFQTLR